MQGGAFNMLNRPASPVGLVSNSPGFQTGFPPSVLVPASRPGSPPVYRPGPVSPLLHRPGLVPGEAASPPRSAASPPRSRSRSRASSRGRAPQERSWFWKLTNPGAIRNSGSANTHRPGSSPNQRPSSPTPPALRAQRSPPSSSHPPNPFAPRTPGSPIAAPPITLQRSVPVQRQGFVPVRSASPPPQDPQQVMYARPQADPHFGINEIFECAPPLPLHPTQP
ncbi:hypothetical protein T484DRAFT_3312830 [Baffinella frigidus]|nr:hypothetical protein T484DRAFT_3312830 [Cryptophyta sp. CCMP2293]